MIISVNVAETNGSTPSLSSLFAVTSTRINISKFHEIRRSKQRFFEQTSHNKVFSHDVTAVILVSQNNDTAAMVVSQTNPLGIELFSYANPLFCSNKFA